MNFQIAPASKKSHGGEVCWCDADSFVIHIKAYDYNACKIEFSDYKNCLNQVNLK